MYPENILCSAAISLATPCTYVKVANRDNGWIMNGQLLEPLSNENAFATSEVTFVLCNVVGVKIPTSMIVKVAKGQKKNSNKIFSKLEEEEEVEEEAETNVDEVVDDCRMLILRAEHLNKDGEVDETKLTKDDLILWQEIKGAC
jgi:hypothetical protein